MTSRPPGICDRAFELEGFQILSFTLPARFHVESHVHATPTLVLQLSGGYTGHGTGRDYEMRAGDVLTLPSEERHAEDVAMPSHALVIGATGERLQRLEVLRHRRRFEDASTRSFVTRAARELSAEDELAPLALEGLLLELLAHLGRTERAADRPGARWLRQARDLVESHLIDPPSLAETARRVGVSRSHLARSFKSTFGCTVGEYVRRRRVERAADLLRRTEIPLADVAQGCGFFDQSHLCRAVREQLGVTPSQVRDDS